MLIHSVISPQQIFNSEEQYEKISYAEYKGVLVEIVKGENRSRIVRIISSDLRHYMNSSIQPSLYINNKELFFRN